MKLFLDTAHLDQIQQGFSLGVIDGVTTNPSLMHACLKDLGNMSMESYIRSILKAAGKYPVSLEVKGGSAADMIQQGKHLYKKFSTRQNSVVIKIPLNPTFDEQPAHFEGLKTIKQLSVAGIPINATLIFTPEQAILAAKAGAAYISPFAGRIDDELRSFGGISFGKRDYFPSYGWSVSGKYLEDNGIISGVDLIKQIMIIKKNYGWSAQIIAASLRNARQVRELAEVGTDIATIPFELLTEMTQHPKSVEGMQAFMKDLVPAYTVLMEGKQRGN